MVMRYESSLLKYKTGDVVIYETSVVLVCNNESFLRTNNKQVRISKAISRFHNNERMWSYDKDKTFRKATK